MNHELHSWIDRMAEAFDTLGDPVNALDLTGTFVYVNSACEELFGYSRSELLGEPLSKIMPTGSAIIDENAIRSSPHGKWVGEVHRLRKSGEVFPVELSVTLIRNEEDTVVGRLGIVRDLTEVRRLEKALGQQADLQSMLAGVGRTANSSLDLYNVCHAIAHEVKTIVPFDRLTINTVDLDDETFTLIYLSGEGGLGGHHEGKKPFSGTITGELVATKTSLLIPCADESFLQRYPESRKGYDAGLRSFISVPLIWNEKVIGSMLLRSLMPDSYGRVDQELIQKVGDQIAGAIVNAGLHDSLQKEAQENEVVARIGRVISESTDINRVFERFTREVAKLIVFHRITITSVDTVRGTATNRFIYGPAQPGRRVSDSFSLSGSAVGEAVNKQRAMLFQPEDFEDISSSFPPRLMVNFKDGLMSHIVAPLLARNQPIGCLSMQSRGIKAYSQRDLKLIQRIADQIAGAFFNSQLFEDHVRSEKQLLQAHEQLEIRVEARTADLSRTNELLKAEVSERMISEEALRESEEKHRQSAEENMVMAEIGQIISSSLDINDVYEGFAHQVLKLIPFDRISICIPDQEMATQHNAYILGTDVEVRRPDVSIPLPGTHTEEVINSQASSLIQTADGEELAILCPGLIPLFQAGLRSFLSTPLISNDRVIGVLHLRSAIQNAYSEYHLGLIGRIASQISSAIANSFLHEEAQHSKELAQSASATKSRYLANMSHEIRTPLNGIIGMIHLMNSSGLTPEQQTHLNMMNAASDSLLSLVNDFLDISKVEAGKLELESIAFSIEELVHSAIDIQGISASDKGLELICDLLPGTSELFVGDPVRLRQVILNLIGNAIKFTDLGHVKIRCELVSRSVEEVEFHFIVRDTGVGIFIADQQKIFEEFTQGDSSTTREYGGTGLGLAISAKLVALMGGRIWVDSEIGQGSSFHFTTRLYTLTSSGATTNVKWSPVQEEYSSSLVKQVRELKVLLVEDNLINQTVALAMLTKGGHEVEVANNGEEALAALEQSNFDLVLMDVQMPRMDGVEATKIIRNKESETNTHVPIIAMTANTMTGDREQYLEVGMDEYISKPLNSDELFRVVNSILHLKP